MLIEHLEIENYDELSSTQTFAKSQLLAGKVAPFTVISALNQTSGKGRYDRDWISKKGNLAISIILPATTNDHQVSYATGIALLDTIKFFYPNISPKLKWVNDVLINDKKVSGILLEKVGKNLIIGIGANLVEDDRLEELNATTLANFGKKIDLSLFLSTFIKNFQSIYNVWLQNGFIPIRNLWKSNCYKLGDMLRVNFPDRTSETGYFKDIDENGNLLMNINGKDKLIQVAELFSI